MIEDVRRRKEKKQKPKKKKDPIWGRCDTQLSKRKPNAAQPLMGRLTSETPGMRSRGSGIDINKRS